MGVQAQELVLKYSADTQDAHTKIAALNKESGEVGPKAQSGASGLLGFFAGGAAVAAAGAAFGFLTSAVGDMIGAASESEQVMAQTNAGIKSTGGVAGMTAQAVSGLADKISALSGIDDEAVQTGENMLLTFTGIGKTVFPMAAQAAADMATKMNGGAIPSAQQMQQQSLLLGKALNDPAKGLSALSREGVTFSDSQKKAILAMVKAGDTAGAQKLMLQELNREFGGAAEAAGNTYPGKLAKLNVAWGNIQETIGGAIIPIISSLMDKLSPLMSALGNALPGILATLGTVFAPVFDGLQDVIGSLLPTVQHLMAAFSGGGAGGGLAMLGGLFTTLLPVIKQVATTFASQMLPVIMTLAQVIITNVMPAVQQVVAALAANLVPILMKLWSIIGPLLVPIFQVLGFIIANVLAPVLVFLINVLGFLISAVLDVILWFGHIGDAAQAVAGFFQGAFKLVQKAVDTAINFVIGLFKTLYDHSYLFQAMVEGIKAAFNLARSIITGVWTFIVGFLSGAWDNIKRAASAAWSAFVGFIAGATAPIRGAIGNIVNAVLGPIQSLIGKMASIGSSIIDGLVGALKAGAGRVMDFLKGMASAALAAVKAVFGIHSPSTEFATIGGHLATGLVEGLIAGDAPGRIAAHLAGAIGTVSGSVGLNVNAGLTGADGAPNANGRPGGGGSSGAADDSRPVNLILDGQVIGRALMPHIVSAARAQGIRL